MEEVTQSHYWDITHTQFEPGIPGLHSPSSKLSHASYYREVKTLSSEGLSL